MVVVLIVCLLLNEHHSWLKNRQRRSEGYLQVCKQLMEVTAKMTYNQGVEKWIIHVV